MSIKDYRVELERKVGAAKVRVDRARPQGNRAAVAAPSEDGMLRVLADPRARAKDRIAAIGGLKLLAFSSANAPNFRPRMIDGLRVAVDDPDVRPAALRALTDLGDASTRERLLVGLREPRKAIVGAADALALLADDVHGDAIAEARKVVDQSRNASEVGAALTILARDPGSKARLHRVIANAKAPAANRRTAAQSLFALDKEALGRVSRAISGSGKIEAFVSALAAVATSEVRAEAVVQPRRAGASPRPKPKSLGKSGFVRVSSASVGPGTSAKKGAGAAPKQKAKAPVRKSAAGRAHAKAKRR